MRQNEQRRMVTCFSFLVLLSESKNITNELDFLFKEQESQSFFNAHYHKSNMHEEKRNGACTWKIFVKKPKRSMWWKGKASLISQE